MKSTEPLQIVMCECTMYTFVKKKQGQLIWFAGKYEYRYVRRTLSHVTSRRISGHNQRDGDGYSFIVWPYYAPDYVHTNAANLTILSSSEIR